MPYRPIDRPGKNFCDLYEFSIDSGRSLVLGCDTNAHHTLWGSTNINTERENLIEFLSSTNLEILNRGNVPTFVTGNRSEVLDVTFASRELLTRVLNWHVSNEESLSDHKEINFDICSRGTDNPLFRNPRNTDWDKFNSILRRNLAESD